MQAAFLYSPVERVTGPVAPLSYGPKAVLPADVDAWVVNRNVTALVVHNNGETLFEEYHQGTKAEDQRIGWSITKSYLSAPVGVLLEDGAIASLDVPVTQYASQLWDGAYQGAYDGRACALYCKCRAACSLTRTTSIKTKISILWVKCLPQADTDSGAS